MSNFISCSQGKTKQPSSMKNWAGNLTYSTENVYEPRTIDEVKEVVKKCSHLRSLRKDAHFIDRSLIITNSNVLCV